VSRPGRIGLSYRSDGGGVGVVIVAVWFISWAVFSTRNRFI